MTPAPIEWRALILAAGRGSRLGSLTADRPKCLVRLGERTLLDWQIRALLAAGISRIAVVVGYRAADLRRSASTCFENPEWEGSGPVSSLLRARDWLAAAPCIVSYGDIVYHPEALRRLLACRHDIAVTYDRAWRRLWEERFERPADDAESFRAHDGLIAEIGAPVGDLDAVQGQFMGLVRFTPLGWGTVEQWLGRLDEGRVRQMDTTTLLRGLIAAGTPVGAVPVDGRWCEVDRARDLELYRARLDSEGEWLHDWRF